MTLIIYFHLYRQAIMEGFAGFIVHLLQLISPQPCYDEIFVKHNFLNGSYYIWYSFIHF